MSLLQEIDWIVIGLYFFLVFGVSIWAAVCERSTQQTTAGYFLAGRNSGWFIIGASLFASNIGSEHLVGLAGTAAASGVAVAQFEILAALILMLLGWFFVPFYISSGVFTMPEFLERRYSSAARWYLAVISIIGYVLTKISVTIAAGGIVFESLMGIDFWSGALVVVIVTGIYTVFGGLRAVLYTDMVQMFILIGGAITVTFYGLSAVGGWDEMVLQADDHFFSMWRPLADPDFPWTGILFGAPILGVWYWCTDQFIVQRVLSASNIDQARRGTLFAGYLKLLPLFIFVIPGVIAFVLAKKTIIQLDVPDQALPTLIGVLLPAGLKGLVVAGLLAALMSSLSSVFNSCSTLFTLDIYKKLKPEAAEKHLVLVGQLATVVLVMLGLAWIPMMKFISGQLFQYLQSVQAYISPPIAAVFLLGIAWPRANAEGAISALITGFILGVARLIAELNKATINGWLFWYADINFLHFAVFLFFICSLVLVVVSLSTARPKSEQLVGLTMATVEPTQPGATGSLMERKKDVFMSLLLVFLVAVLWSSFS